MKFFSGTTPNYERSNAIVRVDFTASHLAQQLAQEILASADAVRRQQLSTALLDALSDCAEIDVCNVKVSDTQQYHRTRNGRTVVKQYGYYRPQSKYIYLQNRTAVRGQILAAKTFLDTLLHEWMHHYDFLRLRLRSIHTAGFYYRLKSLKQTLGVIPPE
ncbi:MAG: hypothetical protein PHI63_01665 [Patescibacteria group bacterium]|nr:hypothetical protein [Patescibacteria group bacterium]